MSHGLWGIQVSSSIEQNNWVGELEREFYHKSPDIHFLYFYTVLPSMKW